MMVFDKTGTLTEDSLAVKGFRAASIVENEDQGIQRIFGEFKEDPNDYLINDWWNKSNAREYMNKSENLFLESMASCHSITYVNDDLIGDPLDVKMFQATGWVLNEDNLGNAGANDEIVLGYMHPQGSYKPT